MSNPTFKPKCPNHGEPLEGCGFPLPRKGTGTCPVSGAPFDFEVELDEKTLVLDKTGKLTPTVGWKVSGND